MVELSKLSCADLLNEHMCAKIEEIAAKLKIKMAEVEKVIKEIVAKGITKIKAIIEELKKHFFPGQELMNDNEIVCEDVLAAKVCKSLREAAKKLKIKVEMVDAIIREAIEKGMTKAKDIIKLVREKMVELSKLSCADLLNEHMCAKIEEIAAKLKIQMAEVEKVIKEIVAKGITKIKAIIEELKKHFFPRLEAVENPIVCEDVLAKQVCDSLRAAAAKLKIKVEMVDAIIREAIAKGITKAQDIIKLVREKMIELTKVTCADILTEKICNKIHEIAELIKVDAKKVDEYIVKLVTRYHKD
jgi:predicted transcriptional regulator